MSSLLVTLACPATVSSRRSSSSGRITWIFFRPPPVWFPVIPVPSGIRSSLSGWYGPVVAADRFHLDSRHPSGPGTPHFCEIQPRARVLGVGEQARASRLDE